MSAWSGGLPGPGGRVSAWSGGLPGLGGMASQHALRQTPPHGQTHTCKNIILATTSLRPVKRDYQILNPNCLLSYQPLILSNSSNSSN